MEKIGYLGPKGTFAFDATLKFAGNSEFTLIEFGEISALIYAADSGDVDLAVVPIENALEGTVNVTIDILVHETKLNIVSEVVMPIRHFLLTKPETEPSDIIKIMSHPQALAQCRKFVYNNFKGIELVPTASTAAAAREVSSCDMPYAAIANGVTADIFGLKIINSDIQDHYTNSTRFVILSKKSAALTGNDKTSIAFSVEDRPGSLLSALKIFADRNINLSKIESRPMKTLLGQYMFIVDFDGHMEDVNIKHMLDELSENSIFYVFLGSYPKYLKDS